MEKAGNVRLGHATSPLRREVWGTGLQIDEEKDLGTYWHGMDVEDRGGMTSRVFLCWPSALTGGQGN